jgi:hypothetical protein
LKPVVPLLCEKLDETMVFAFLVIPDSVLFSLS